MNGGVKCQPSSIRGRRSLELSLRLFVVPCLLVFSLHIYWFFCFDFPYNGRLIRAFFDLGNITGGGWCCGTQLGWTGRA